MILSKLHEKCKECKNKDKCDDKRMVACGYIELKPNLNPDLSTPSLSTAINIKEHDTSDVNFEDIKRQIEKEIYKGLGCNIKYFNLK